MCGECVSSRDLWIFGCRLQQESFGIIFVVLALVMG
jgi:hypothetical protein